MNNSLETAQAEPRSAVFSLYLDIFHHSETLTRDIWLFFIRLSILSMESSPWRKIESRKKISEPEHEEEYNKPPKIRY